MVDAGPAGDGRRRGKKNRGRPGGTNKKKRSKGRGGNRTYQQGSYLPEPVRDDSSILGSRPTPTQPVPVEQEEGPPDAFRLFCAYHLGVTIDDGYQKPRTDEVARRFGFSIDELKQQLEELGVDEKALREINFDLEGAKIDIRVAPPGISKTEVAREHFEEFLEMKETAQNG